MPASSSPTGTGPSTTASGITIKNFGFSGALTVKPGQKVTVTNQDSVAHTLTDKQTHLFDTGNIAGNAGTATFTAPAKAGSYPFGCTYHSEMAGTLVVQS
ncbi:MAG: cupredoxin domain-containing protein [Actinomycetota bacterium]|nr:cupredoxin domain-containing protein [Actinomycetota bacterium]